MLLKWGYFLVTFKRNDKSRGDSPALLPRLFDHHSQRQSALVAINDIHSGGFAVTLYQFSSRETLIYKTDRPHRLDSG